MYTSHGRLSAAPTGQAAQAHYQDARVLAGSNGGYGAMAPRQPSPAPCHTPGVPILQQDVAPVAMTGSSPSPVAYGPRPTGLAQQQSPRSARPPNGRPASMTPVKPLSSAVQAPLPVNTAEAKATVSKMHSDMREVERMILALEEENSALKLSLLSQRARTLEKYFLSADSNLLHATFGAWRRAVCTMRRNRDVEDAHAMRAEEAASFETTIVALEKEFTSQKAEFEGQIAKALRQLVPMQSECQLLEKRAVESEFLLRQIAEVTLQYSQPQQIRGTLSGQFGELRESLCHILTSSCVDADGGGPV